MEPKNTGDPNVYEHLRPLLINEVYCDLPLGSVSSKVEKRDSREGLVWLLRFVSISRVRRHLWKNSPFPGWECTCVLGGEKRGWGVWSGSVLQRLEDDIRVGTRDPHSKPEPRVPWVPRLPLWGLLSRSVLSSLCFSSTIPVELLPLEVRTPRALVTTLTNFLFA